MAGAGLIGIRRRIKSVTNIRKITKAMGLVSTAKLRKARVNLEINKKYYNEYKVILKDIINFIEDSNIYIDGNGSHKKLYVIFTSDSGLCGSFNINIINNVINEIKEDKENSLVIVIGQKGRMYLKKLGINTLAEYIEIPDVPTTKEARTIAKNIIKLYSSKEVGEVFLVYSEFYSPVKQQVLINKILPFTKENKSDNKYIEFNPPVTQFMDEILENYLKATILNCFSNSKASENGSRMTAMNGATDNANDLLDNLDLQFNRLRQSAITQEISEIVGGAEAQR
ncbi:ATP synthase F1 subunit gamma [Clostridium botulinum]|uniref:ATP synthase gamma chain n=1 Tax=Clostridium botulinum (strain Langeland / NCTC 10281 / Type F) TaxID=441772 RepID=ATPG_CLOBL|nr:ATP synthase F1 subunit gamma [Clostridium botulinum]A7G9Q8.1 RecName: Full=ATP synthase gamma chain; AltName: Full=ATP synthase F1 sector gamma subunit; AltName: Full=F-ATPase gamma subunit [Clostridium botulinum F str. Langeland]ABS40283.1 ATP synthase F1, gamma subunit [Clostridium botulinum F str. Langeland]ADF97995.1 ATP synthase F1, gamma subunit [Clostridium botulinum F str. 230613]KKM41650.1 ATP synthase F0F1 subunit gamma [Clostridium botulinum]MBY6792832.1 F0F1 ATP synthase subuni